MQDNPLVHDFVQFIKHEKKWWLTPLAALAVVSLLLILFTGGSEAAPFLYPTN